MCLIEAWRPSGFRLLSGGALGFGPAWLRPLKAQVVWKEQQEESRLLGVWYYWFWIFLDFNEILFLWSISNNDMYIPTYGIGFQIFLAKLRRVWQKQTRRRCILIQNYKALMHWLNSTIMPVLLNLGLWIYPGIQLTGSYKVHKLQKAW